jgi:broad specificity phosphatase PhoE
MNTVYLIRHGEAFSNLSHVFSYRKIDLSLTPKGQLQARQMAAAFQQHPVDEIYASPLKRTVETAEILACSLGIPFTVIENFREVNVGDLEGLDDLEQAWRINFDTWAAWARGQVDLSYPGGEDWNCLYRRMVDGLYPLLEGQEERRIAVVAHGGIITATLARLVDNINFYDMFSSPSHNCSITETRLHAQDGRITGELVRWSDISHLSGEAAVLLPGVPEDPSRSRETEGDNH